MSALGQKQTCAAQKVMSASPPIADICGAQVHVRFGSKADICGAKSHVRFDPQQRTCAAHNQCPLCAIADIGPSTHLGFWPSLIQELPAGSAGAFLEALMPSADKINFVKMIVCRYGAPQNRP